MPSLLKFRLTDGLITGIWEGNSVATLAAQVVPDDATFGYLPVETDLRAQALLETKYVTAGALTEKTVLALAGTPTPFAADGVTTCTISVTAFVPCTLLADGTPHILTPGDQTLVLTSNTPHVFTIALAPVGPYRATPITVEAT